MGRNEEHDPMCPARCDFGDPSPAFGAGSCRGGDCTRCDESDCYCDFIAAVRADTEPDIRKRVAEEIARRIERMVPAHPKMWDGKWLVGRRMAANVARRIGSEARPNGL